MKIKKILKKNIKELLKASVIDWDTYVPMKTEVGDVLFSPLPKKGARLDKSLDKVSLKDEWVIISPKDIFFPQLENMFCFDKGKIAGTVEVSKKLIFGIKPCDTKGMLFADEFFRRNYEDIYYLSRAKERLVVTIGCLKPPRPKTCFCTSAGTGPFINAGFDLQMVDTKDAYIVEIGTEKGEEFTALYPQFFLDAGKNEAAVLEGIKSAAAEAVGLKVDFKNALEKMKDSGNFEENYRRIGERCIYCGACLYVCPTCTCFNVFDNKAGDKGVRRRNWDTCVFEGYTREASGHNPRGEKYLRTARRYEHKLKYDYAVTGSSGCIGCGRCLSSCPVDIGISKFITEVATGKKIM